VSAKPKSKDVGKDKGRKKSEVREWVKSLSIGILAVLIFRSMVAQAYQIPSGSMERTLLVGDYIYINKMLYGPELDVPYLLHHRFPAFRKPQRGDIIVFRYPVDLRKDFIKRCVAVEGQSAIVDPGSAGAEAFYQTRRGLLEGMQNFTGQVYTAARFEFRRNFVRGSGGGAGSILQRPLCVHDTLVHNLHVFKMLVEFSQEPGHSIRRMRTKTARPH